MPGDGLGGPGLGAVLRFRGDWALIERPDGEVDALKGADEV